ncbi:4Fe-4S binding protein [Desulfitibacter alkalitolerans]|uniref:4Fe-4S binding protein n=1 Tax=Desulfitibacter alkalitolerans TaxID=264641 RepID=UPI00047F7FA3|nr:4Fe-4S binding protein [Desulfitibacter alkalitolerans]
MKLKGINENCSGCRTCQVVCALENYREINPAKAALGIEGKFPEPGTYAIHYCNQCGTCADVCPTGAIYERDGIYILDKDQCSSCMNCVEECPLGVMYVHDSLDAPIKCNSCGECAETCPRNALIMENA